MSASLLLVAAAPVIVSDAERVVIDISVPQPCDDHEDIATSGEILVCGQADRNARYRLRPDTYSRAEELPMAQVRLSENASAAIETESADMGMARAQRAMVRFKLKF